VLALAGEGGVVLWDVNARRAIGEPVSGFPEPFLTAFSRDGHRLAVFGVGGALAVWDLAAHRAVTPLLPAQPAQLPHLLFGADESTVWTTNEFSAPFQWDLDPDAWLQRVCRVANRRLSKAEWQRYIGADLPYRDACAPK